MRNRPKNNGRDAPGPVAEVLAAEQLSRDRLTATREAASALLEETRAATRRIERRAEVRIRTVHAICQRRVGARRSALRAALEELAEASDAALSSATVEAVVERVAWRLIVGDGDEP